MVGGNLTFEALPDDVLLLVFSLCNPRGHAVKPVTWQWCRLAHVCQRWRRIVFASPRYLGLVIVTGDRHESYSGSWSVRRALACWPAALPIAIRRGICEAFPMLDDDEDDILAGLKHPDRIYEINFSFSWGMLGKSESASLAWSFPELERLEFRGAHGFDIDAPRGFLGGSTPTSHKLRHIKLLKITFPSLPQLLLSNHNLVYLSLGRGLFIGERYEHISPDTLAFCLSAATQLKILHVEIRSNLLNPKQRSTHSESLSPNLTLLPSLVEFDFKGPNGYLEDLVSSIRSPLLRRIGVSITLMGVRPLDLSNLCQLLSQSKYLQSLPFQTSIEIEEDGFEIVHDFEPPPPRESISLNVDFGGHEAWDVSRVVHFSGKLSPPSPGVERLIISALCVPPSLRDEPDTVRWLQLLMPFNGAQEVHLCDTDHSYDGIVNALHESIKMGQEVFPALRILRLCGYGTKTPQGIKSFVDERQRTGKTVNVVHRREWPRSGWSRSGHYDDEDEETVT